MLPQASTPNGASTPPLDHSSSRLLARAKLGDASALGRLVSRHLPALRRWAHGRLNRWARGAADTTDLVHDALWHTIRRIDSFERRGPGALGAYLRQAVLNRIRDEQRRVMRRGVVRSLSETGKTIADGSPSPLDAVLAHELEARYRAALNKLSDDDRELVVAHIELDYSHEQLGCMTGRSRDAARMALQRAVRRMADHLRAPEHDG